MIDSITEHIGVPYSRGRPIDYEWAVWTGTSGRTATVEEYDDGDVILVLRSSSGVIAYDFESAIARGWPDGVALMLIMSAFLMHGIVTPKPQEPGS